MRVAISGADGFLGMHLIERLHNEEVDLVAITVEPSRFEMIATNWNRFEVVEATANKMMNSTALDGVDVFIACAYPRAAKEKDLAPGMRFVYESLGILLDKGCKSVVNISTQSLYDPHRSLPAKEDDPILLTNIYASTKYCVELYVDRICNDKDVYFTNLRLSSLVGIGFDQRFVNKMVKSALYTGEIAVSDEISAFSFLDVRDAAEGIARLIRVSPNGWNHVYNLGARESFRTVEIAQMVATEVFKATTIQEPITITTYPGSEIRRNNTIDSTALCNLLGWKPEICMRDFIRRLVLFELDKNNDNFYPVQSYVSGII